MVATHLLSDGEDDEIPHAGDFSCGRLVKSQKDMYFKFKI